MMTIGCIAVLFVAFAGVAVGMLSFAIKSIAVAVLGLIVLFAVKAVIDGLCRMVSKKINSL